MNKGRCSVVAVIILQTFAFTCRQRDCACEWQNARRGIWLDLTLSFHWCSAEGGFRLPPAMMAALVQLVDCLPEPTAEELAKDKKRLSYAIADGRWLIAHADAFAIATEAAGTLLGRSWG